MLQQESSDNFGQQRSHQQRNHRRTGQTDEAQGGKHGFSRSVSRDHDKNFARHLQFGIFGAI